VNLVARYKITKTDALGYNTGEFVTEYFEWGASLEEIEASNGNLTLSEIRFSHDKSYLTGI
jgi:hypothetical protein